MSEQITPLLYDRAMEIAVDTKHAGELSGAVVYEVSDVLGLFEDDHGEEMARKVNRRPPGRNVWVEWVQKVPYGDDVGIVVTGRIAVWLRSIPPSELADIYRKYVPSGGLLFLERLGRVEEAHLTMCFSMLDHYGPGRNQELETQKKAGVILLPDVYYCLWRDGGTETEFFKLPDANRTVPFEGMVVPLGGSGVADQAVLHGSLWPAFMAFSMLNCVNISTTEAAPSSLRQKDRKRAGKPKLTKYRTLYIEVPREESKRRAEDHYGDDGVPKVRQHVCRGHPRLLSSERFTNMRGRTVWVPQHVRGSAELGRVTGPRKLTANKPSDE